MNLFWMWWNTLQRAVISWLGLALVSNRRSLNEADRLWLQTI